jgi:hypothetical protein
MRTRIIPIILFTAAIISCGGNNQVAITRIHQPGRTADVIFSTESPSKELKTTILHVQKKSNEPLVVDRENITPQDDFTVNDIVSPVEKFNVPKEHYQMIAEEGGNFTYHKTGSTVSIPPDALVDKKGDPVTGQVDISYREFHTPKEIFFSGIPMDFDVNGEKQYFESAGMIDIQASQNNEEVFIKKGKAISFNMSTDNSNKEVKLYELDKTEKKWKELGEAPVVTVPAKRKKIWGAVYKTDIVNERTRHEFHIYIDEYLTKYSKEDHTYKRKIRFRINMPKIMSMKNKGNKMDFIHANWLNNTIFEVEGYKRTQFKKMMDQFRKLKYKDESFRYQGILADATIKNVNYPNMTIEMTYEGKKVELDVQLYYKSAKSDKGKKKIFDAIANFPINNFDGRHTLTKTNEWCVDHYDSIYPGRGEDWLNKMVLQREFQSKNFGILNCDQPKSLPKEMIANATFFNEDGEFMPSNVVLTDFDRNVMFTYYAGYYGKFGYNPGVKNFIFTVDQEGMVSYILPEEINAIEDKSNLVLHMHKIHMEKFSQVMEELFPTKTEYSYTL